MKVGDTIECKDAEDLIHTMNELEKDGIETEILLKKDGKKVYMLVVTKITRKTEER